MCEIGGGDVIPDKDYTLKLKRYEERSEIYVNGIRFVSTIKLPPFQADTEMFIGGLAPGIVPHSKLNVTSHFNGCIFEVSRDASPLPQLSPTDHCCHIQLIF